MVMHVSPRGKYRVDRQPARLRFTGEYLVDMTKATVKAGGTYRARTGPRCCNSGCGKR